MLSLIILEDRDTPEHFHLSPVPNLLGADTEGTVGYLRVFFPDLSFSLIGRVGNAFLDALAGIAAGIVHFVDNARHSAGAVHLQQRRAKAFVGAGNLRHNQNALTRREQHVNLGARDDLQLLRGADLHLGLHLNIRQVHLPRISLKELLVQLAVFLVFAVIALAQNGGQGIQRPHGALRGAGIRIGLQRNPAQSGNIRHQHLNGGRGACLEARGAIRDIRADIVIGLRQEVVVHVVVADRHAHRPAGAGADVGVRGQRRVEDEPHRLDGALVRRVHAGEDVRNQRVIREAVGSIDGKHLLLLAVADVDLLVYDVCRVDGAMDIARSDHGDSGDLRHVLLVKEQIDDLSGLHLLNFLIGQIDIGRAPLHTCGIICAVPQRHRHIIGRVVGLIVHLGEQLGLKIVAQLQPDALACRGAWRRHVEYNAALLGRAAAAQLPGVEHDPAAYALQHAAHGGVSDSVAIAAGDFHGAVRQNAKASGGKVHRVENLLVVIVRHLQLAGGNLLLFVVHVGVHDRRHGPVYRIRLTVFRIEEQVERVVLRHRLPRHHRRPLLLIG